MRGHSPESAGETDPFQMCLRHMEVYVLAQGRPYYFQAGAIPQLRRAEGADPGPYDVYARVGSVMIEDVAARQPDTPIMYDVHVFTDSGQAASGLAARLTKHLDRLETAELLDFSLGGQVTRSYIDHTYEVREVGRLSPEEVVLLAEQLSTLGPIERPLPH